MRWMLALISIAVLGGVVWTVRPGKLGAGRYLLPTGQIVEPAGTPIEVNDRPLGLTLSPDGRTIAVVTGSDRKSVV